MLRLKPQRCRPIFIFKEFTTNTHETEHLYNVGLQHHPNNNHVERLQGTVRERNKTQRGLKSEDSVFIKGHQLYCNFIKPHKGLNGYTPAHFSNIYLGLGDKKWENLLNQSINYNDGKNIISVLNRY